MPGPSLADRVIRWLAPMEWQEAMRGDLEDARRRRLASGRRANPLWAIATAIEIAGPLALERVRLFLADLPRSRSMLMTGLGTDIRQAWKSLRSHPGYLVTAVLTLAVGVGANASVFSLADWLLLRDVPGIVDRQSLVTLGYGRDNARGPISMVEFNRVAAGTPALERLVGYQEFPLHVSATGRDAERVTGEVVTAGYFAVLGGPLTVGRGFTNDESAPGGPSVVVVSHRLWQRSLGGRPDVVGSTVTVNGHPFTVVGVTARGFRGASRAGGVDMWVTVAQHRIVMPSYPDTLLTSRTTRFLFGLLGRLAPGATPAEVAAQVDVAHAAMAAEFPNDRRLQTWRFDVQPGFEARPWVVSRVGAAVGLLFGFVSLLLLLSTANLASLMVARASTRRSEVATRLALGASRVRVARLLFVESLVLSLIASGIAVAVVWVAAGLLEGTRVLRGLPPLERIGIAWPVVLFALAVAAVVAVVAGLLPALGGSRVALTAAMGETGRGFSPTRQRLRRTLTVVQVALSLALLIGAGLLTRSILTKLSLDPGFDSRQVLSFSVEPGLQTYPGGQDAFYRDLLARLGETPGTRAAGLAWLQPYSQGAADTAFTVAGRTDEVSAQNNMVSPGFFDALGMQIVSGRDFTAGEFLRRAELGEGSVILTESLARRIFGAVPAVGQRLAMRYPEGHTRTVVGVVADARLRSVTDTEGTLFEPFGQSFSSGRGSVMVGLTAPAGEVLPAIRDVVKALDPSLPLYDIMTLDEAVRRQLADDLLVARLAAILSVMATLLSAIGLHGVLARAVVDRRREMAIRLALGATPAGVASLVGRDAAWLVGWGVALGLPSAWGLSRFVESRLFGISRLDGPAIGVAVAVLAVLAVVAVMPAMRRAASGDPVSSLRA